MILLFVSLNVILVSIFGYLFLAKVNVNDIAFIVLIVYIAVAIAMFVKLKRRSVMARVG